MKLQSLTVGKFFGIQLRIHYSWLVIFGLVLWSVITGYLPAFRPGLSLSIRTAAGLVVTVLFFASVIAHEFAHSLVAKARGLKIRHITLFLFGGAAELTREPTSAKTELYMTLAGPATSLAIAAISLLIWSTSYKLHLTAIEIIAGPLTILNFVVGVFNLLPAYPLDGGRVLRAIIWIKTKDIVYATRAASVASYALSYLMMTFGFLEFLAGVAISGLWLIFLGFFLHQTTKLSYMQTIDQKTLSSARVSDIMNEHFITVPDHTTIDEFLNNYVLKYKQYDFLVTKKGQIIGVIEFAHVAGVKQSERNQPIERFQKPLPKNLILLPEHKATKAIRLMQVHGLPILPVYINQSIAGIVTTNYINDYLFIHRAQHGIKTTKRYELFGL